MYRYVLLLPFLIGCATATPLIKPTSDPSAISTEITATVTSQPTNSPIPPTATVVPTSSPIPPTATVVPTSTPTNTPTSQPTPSPTITAEHYVFPVQVHTGQVQYGKYHHDYPATDIFCPKGSDFVAPIDGIVDYISTTDLWNPRSDNPADRGGLSVAIIGSDGVRYYGSHLSQVADGITPGVHVTAGQLLGKTGNSGNARGVAAHLHFGISHPTTPDDWQIRRGEISPYPYLQAWQHGEDRKPVVR